MAHAHGQSRQTPANRLSFLVLFPVLIALLSAPLADRIAAFINGSTSGYALVEPLPGPNSGGWFLQPTEPAVPFGDMNLPVQPAWTPPSISPAEAVDVPAIAATLKAAARGDGDSATLAPLWAGATMCGAVVRSITDCSPETAAWVYRNLALTAQRQAQTGRLQAALAADLQSVVFGLFQKSLAAWPDAEVYAEMASFLAVAGRMKEALTAYDAAIALAPTNAKIHVAVGLLLHDHRMWDPAQSYFKRAHELDPSLDAAFAHHVYLSLQVAEWGGHGAYDSLMASLAERTSAELDIVEAERADPRNAGNPLAGVQVSVNLHPWSSLNYPLPAALKLRVARNFAHRQFVQAQLRANFAGLGELAETRIARWVNRPWRVRVGFVSADFKNKATAYLCYTLFKAIPRDALEVFVYATTADEAPVPSAWRAAIRAGADHFRELHSLPSPDAMRVILDDSIDILLDMDGYSNEGLRMSDLFAVRLAPITALYFVYMGTLGNPCAPAPVLAMRLSNAPRSPRAVDYVISDDVATPPDREGGRSEALLLLPPSFFPNSHPALFPPPHYGLPGGTARSPEAYGLPPGAFVYCSFNKHLKISPHLWDVWMAILGRVPHSVLWLLHNPKESEPRLRARAAVSGMAARIYFAPFVNTAEEHFPRLATAGVMLDTTIYGSHTGAVDALWAAVPMVTCVGHCVPPGHESDLADQMASRVCASMLSAVNATELIAASLAQYVDIAVRLAVDPAFHARVRTKLLRARAPDTLSPLWDMARYARRLEQGLLAAWRNFVAGRPPRLVRAADESSPPPP